MDTCTKFSAWYMYNATLVSWFELCAVPTWGSLRCCPLIACVFVPCKQTSLGQAWFFHLGPSKACGVGTNKSLRFTCSDSVFSCELESFTMLMKINGQCTLVYRVIRWTHLFVLVNPTSRVCKCHSQCVWVCSAVYYWWSIVLVSSTYHLASQGSWAN